MARRLLPILLLLTWAAALAALLAGHPPALPLTLVPLAGFAAGFATGRDWAAAGDGSRIARGAVAVVALGVAAGLWAAFDPDDYRAFLIFIAMMATVCPLLTGLFSGAWVGAQSRP